MLEGWLRPDTILGLDDGGERPSGHRVPSTFSRGAHEGRGGGKMGMRARARARARMGSVGCGELEVMFERTSSLVTWSLSPPYYYLLNKKMFPSCRPAGERDSSVPGDKDVDQQMAKVKWQEL